MHLFYFDFLNSNTKITLIEKVFFKFYIEWYAYTSDFSFVVLEQKSPLDLYLSPYQRMEILYME